MRIWGRDLAGEELVSFLYTWVRSSLYMFVIFVVLYMFIELAEYSVNPIISCGACKLTRTPRII